MSNSLNRRTLVGATALSAAGLLAIADARTPAYAKLGGKKAEGQDADLLNAALALELEGIAAYGIAAGSGLLTPDVVKVGVLFQGHHKQHADELRAAIGRLGGKPVEAKSESEYAAGIGASSLKNQADVLRLALKLERGAANAYLGLIQPLRSTDLHLLAARISADEVVHANTLAAALGEAIPEKAFLFG